MHLFLDSSIDHLVSSLTGSVDVSPLFGEEGSNPGASTSTVVPSNVFEFPRKRRQANIHLKQVSFSIIQILTWKLVGLIGSNPVLYSKVQTNITTYFVEYGDTSTWTLFSDLTVSMVDLEVDIKPIASTC